ncbi:class I SAM-dependent methyltransferase [Halorubrum trueperi]|uniref:Class I SAM-dependent methyltransferase n=1 Tax=Halorubrum trueperi TaxID=2004704 RepID=A0ABD5UG34_9EURY
MSNRSRFEFVEPYVTGKEVLDFGCVQHTPNKTDRDDWFHDMICDVASYTVGVDTVEEGITKLTQEGYNVHHGDVKSIRLDEKFDVVVAGELIEHLADFESFFETVRYHLRDDGVLILTTPNAFSLYFWLKCLLDHEFVNPDHTCWFDASTLSQLLESQNYSVKKMMHAKMSRRDNVNSPSQFKGWLIESLLPPRVSHRNLIAVASPE